MTAGLDRCHRNKARQCRQRKRKVNKQNQMYIIAPSIWIVYCTPTVLPYEHIYLENLPNAESYERSYMHLDVITHLVSTKTEFVVTASIDGHIKFWKKMDLGIDFVKHFRSHLVPVKTLTTNSSGTLLCSAATDQTAKVFDVVNFDMINIIRLGYTPLCSEWISSPGDAVQGLAM